MVANPPCGVETSSCVEEGHTDALVANPPCGVETNLMSDFEVKGSLLLIHRVELKLVFFCIYFLENYLVANPPCGVETIRRFYR